jgi:hypothetical protein
VSGESVLLVAEADSVPYRSIERLAEVTPRLPAFALIGGLAVIARLGQAHRATNDVDAVSDDRSGLLDVLVTDGAERFGDSVMLDNDLKMDVIDVSEGDTDYLPYLTHRLAFDTRTPVQLVVQPHRGPSTSAYIDVARPAALVAVKLGIGESVGRQRDPRKVGSDAFDVVRLMQRFGPDALADELSSIADPDFVVRITELARRHLVLQADRTVAAMVRSSVQGVERVDPAQVELLGETFVQRLTAQGNER